MSMAMIKLRPGVNAELTPSLNEAGISVSSLIRFRAGLPEKLGGWDKYVQFAVGGVPKAMHAWLDFNEQRYLTVGTTTILANIPEGSSQIVDITPQIFTSDFTPDFSTTISTPVVTVDDPNIQNVTDLDAVYFPTPISVGGLILQGVYPISVVTGATTYQIIAAANAAASVSGGGAVPVFEITVNDTEVNVLLEDHGLAEADTISLPIPTVISVTGNDSFTKSLLHFNGADAGTTITDSNAGGSAHSWTAAGNAQIDTAQSQFGGASLLLDGTGDWVTTADSADFTLGTSDFTIDLWVRPSADGSALRIAGQGPSGLAAASTAWYLERLATNKIRAHVSDGATFTTLDSTTSIIAGAWWMVALVRDGNTLRLFIDGVEEASTAFSATVPNSTNALRVGAAGEDTNTPWAGWLDEFRLSVGAARWDDDFTPPVAEYGATAITIQGTYSVIAVTDADNFSIAISQLPDASSVVAMNGGDAELVYYIAIGPTTSGTGYGVGTYGSGTYGIGVPPVGQQMGAPVAPEDWTLDNWGDTLLACPEGGGIYSWRPNTGLETGQLIAEGPLFNEGMFISQQTQMVIAYGSTADQTIGLDRDPLLVKWCDNGNFLSWAPGVASQAGSRRLSTGSKIVGGLSVAQQELLWTDLGLWAMSYLGSLAAGVWGFNQIGVSCGLIGKHAVARLGAYVYWMSAANFFRLGTSPEVIPCTVWDVVFQDLNTALDPSNGQPYSEKSWAWANTPFNEVWFFYPRASTGATEPDAFAKLNTLDGTWDYGPQPGSTTQIPRSCGIDQSILGRPISATPAGIIYQHETSRNADGAPLIASFETGWFQLSDGADNMFVDWFLPDFKWNEYPDATGASIKITLYSAFYPGATPQTHGPFTVTAATPYFNPRIRGRLVKMKVESDDLDSFWRLGGCRARISPDGKVP